MILTRMVKTTGQNRTAHCTARARTHGRGRPGTHTVTQGHDMKDLKPPPRPDLHFLPSPDIDKVDDNI